MNSYQHCLSVLFICMSGALIHAEEMELTIYDDGRSCPGDCDAHVVFHGSHNGTANAFSPDSSASSPSKCSNGQFCKICFDESPSSCMEVTYRGSGPPMGKFDFTPAFFNENCGRNGLPQALKLYCKGLQRAVQNAGYDTRLNCFDTTTHTKCKDTMTRAQKAYDDDLPFWEACISEGQAAFNARQPDESTRRIYNCAYSKLSLGGPNRNGVRWKLLLPAACRPGTYVGRDGLDCCDGNAFTAAGLHPECSIFHPRP